MSCCSSMHHAPSMIDPALEPPCRLVSEKYRVRGWTPAATYHKVSRFAPGRGASWTKFSIGTDYKLDYGFFFYTYSSTTFCQTTAVPVKKKKQ